MANKVLLKKSSVAGKVPLSTDLDYGEVALNYADGKLYYKSSTNVISTIGGASSSGFTQIDRQSYTATAGQTVFNITYIAPYVDVYLNGVHLSDEDYTASGGTSITLFQAAAAGDQVDLVGFSGTLLTPTVKSNGDVLIYNTTSGVWENKPQSNLTSGNVSGIVAVANGGTGSSTAAGARTNLSAAILGANNDITSMSGITGNLSTINKATFATAPTGTTVGAGQVFWDNARGSMSIGMNANVAGLANLTNFFYIKASAAISIGQVIMFTGSVGASGTLTGAPATGVTDGTYIMGIAAENIALNGFGYVQCFGLLKGFDTSAFTGGQALWYDPTVTGGLTTTQPTAPNVKVQLAAVVNSGVGGSGSVFIRVTAGSAFGGTDSNVLFSTLSNNDMVKYNAAAGYWYNVAGPSSALVGVSDTQTLSNKSLNAFDQKSGSTSIANQAVIQTTVASTAQTAVDTFATATYRSAKYVVQITQGTNYQMSEIMVMHNGTTTTMTEYGMMNTGGVLGTFTTDVSTGNVRLLVTMGAATSSTINIVRTTIVV